MKLNFTLTLSLILLAFASHAQDLTGIWRGYFSSSSGLYKDDQRSEMYRYEIQIEQQDNNGIKGVTYSYKSTVFYGKAGLQGLYTVQTKNLILKETGMIDLKIADRSEPCLMTCYLEYTKIGKLEVLQGTFISINARDKSDCGSGKVYLERVKETDFELEEFLVNRPGNIKKKNIKKDEITKTIPKKTTATTPKTNQAVKSQVKTTTTNITTKKPAPQKTATPPPPTKNTNSATNNTAKNTIPKNQPAVTKKLTPPPVKNTSASKVTPPPAAATQKKQTETTTTGTNKTPVASQAISVQPRQADTVINQRTPAHVNTPPKIPIPKVLLERTNNLVRTLYTNEKIITVEIYDNGIIDDDTISLYHNNRLAISHGKLSNTPFKLKLDCSEEKRHELIMVAENLGEIPPNTALMVITAGKKRYEIFLTSNEERNAKVVVEYRE